MVVDHSGLSSRSQLVGAVVVCLVLAVTAVGAIWSIHEALEERQAASATIDLRLAAYTVAAADALSIAGAETSAFDLAGAMGELQGDHDLAFRVFDPDEREEVERLLTEIANCGAMLLSDDGHDHEPHDHEELQAILSAGAARAEHEAVVAEQRAIGALAVGAMIAAVAAVFLVRSRISELRLRRDLLHQANTDELTGLPNRRALDAILTNIARGIDSATSAAGFVLLDLDGFKGVNDTLGHRAGDELLTQIAARLKSVQRPDDVLIRLGGDEFAVILPNLLDPRAAEQVAYRYLQVLGDPFTIGVHPEHLRTSIGVATTTDPRQVDKLMHQADTAMYDAKTAGGNRVSVFEPTMETDSDRTVQITRALRAADHDREFSVVYQPIVAIDGLTVVGYEALLRWDSPSLGPVGPAEFIPVAERAGEICEIGRWVLDTITRELTTWEATGRDAELYMSWNVSPHQLAQDRFVTHVLDTLDAAGVPRHRLVVEVTESAVIDPRGTSVQRLHELRHAGIRISIDDFGSGYSNLGQLLQVPFDIIKIDRSLLLTLSSMREQAGGDPSGPCAIMTAIVSIAGVFNAPVVCEGVETDQQRQSLQRSGITHIQGYLIGRPGPLPHNRQPQLMGALRATNELESVT
jgi:diguanylate cyclase (GGDEF)-like protein